MKISKKNEDFKPITLTITFETLEEAQDFYNIHNHVGITINTRSLNHRGIRKELELACTYKIVTETFSEFTNNLKTHFTEPL